MVELLDWTVALLPALLMVGLFVWLDVFKLMSLKEILLLLLLGGVAALAAYPISGRLIDQLPLGFSFYSRFIAPWIEETLKAIAVIALMLANRIGYKLDAVISGFAIGAGFSVVENILYLLRFPELGQSVWMVRGLGTALMHGATCALLAAVAHELAERANRRTGRAFRFNPLWILPGLLLAILIHTIFNQFPDQPMVAMMGSVIATPLVLIAIFHFGANEAQQWLAEDSAAHRDALDQLRAGVFPGDESGRRIAALATRLGDPVRNRVLAFVTAEMALVVAAEEKLLGTAPAIDQLGALFAERDALKHQLGRTTLAALDPLLPFSRNDRWEVAELREDVKRG
ncbi:MAG: PrsW family intramembrane metalloprotease [Sphingomonas bacterium]|nr:PrsW family intramembrane metalloprotease [Sphingomonas bacterium]